MHLIKESSIKTTTMYDKFTKVSKITGKTIAALILFSILFQSTWAQWSTNAYLNTPVCTGENTQAKPVSVSDGHGGVIIAWSDARNVQDENIYAQHLDSSGIAQWTLNGIPICSATSLQAQVAIISDGNGGAIISWADFRNGNDADIYAQRVNGNGIVQWATTDGIGICTAKGDQTYPVITTDGNGGAIFTWFDERIFNPVLIPNIYVQGINANGTLKWTEAAICTNMNGQTQPAIVSDSTGGAFIVWKDGRNGLDGTSGSDLYAQHIGSNGLIKWMVDGISICKAYRDQDNPKLTTDGSGGAIVTWQDARNLNDSFPYNTDIYAQRINTDGVVQWIENGIPICKNKDNNKFENIVSDDSGGAIITWENESGTGNTWATSYVYVQRINTNGNVLWMNNGIPISAGNTVSPKLVSDKKGGAFLEWKKYVSSGGTSDVYAQHIDENGTELWVVYDILVSNAYGNQENSSIVTDDNGGIIVTWDDSRNTLDIYAQHVKTDGTLGGGTLSVDKFSTSYPEILVYPNPTDQALYIDASTIPSNYPVLVSIIDITGRTLETISGTGVITLSLNIYKPAVYIVQIKYDGQIITRRVIKK